MRLSESSYVLLVLLCVLLPLVFLPFVITCLIVFTCILLTLCISVSPLLVCLFYPCNATTLSYPVFLPVLPCLVSLPCFLVSYCAHARF